MSEGVHLRVHSCLAIQFLDPLRERRGEGDLPLLGDRDRGELLLRGGGERERGERDRLRIGDLDRVLERLLDLSICSINSIFLPFRSFPSILRMTALMSSSVWKQTVATLVSCL